MLTQKDVDYLKEELSDVFATKSELNELKDQVLSSLDAVMGEIKSFREEMTLIPDRLVDHTDRIEKLEQIHPHGRHPQTTA